MTESDTKQRIVAEAINLLDRIGPSSMTMDLVAHNCGISKRTLYEKFPDKKTLIATCLRVDHEQQNDEIRRLYNSYPDAFEAMLRVYFKVKAIMQGKNLDFFNDIKRMYPDLFNDHKQREREIVMALSRVLLKAQKAGDVREEVNTELAAYLFITTMQKLHTDFAHNQFNFAVNDLVDGAFLNFMRGVSSYAGLQKIDDIIAKNNEIKQNKQ